jgi:EAL and modified HD-GYP domain-containing signal transduction protein
MVTPSPTQICVGRQPIYDAARNIVAYEVLYRCNASSAEFEDGDAATARVLVNILTEIGLDQISGSKPLFINCTRYFLEHEPVLPPDRCTLEILETVAVDQATVDAVARQHRRGYKIALDDFEFRKEWDPLLKLADYVKVDVRQHQGEGLREAVERLRDFPGTLVAEKIETQQELDYCRTLGFTLFQGYYLRRPETLVARAAPNNLIALVSLSQQLMDQNSDASAIAQAIQGDVTLTYRLLRLANSAMTGSRKPIDSVRQAVCIAGTNLLARWVALLGLLRIENSPSDYVEIALHRARTCELVSRAEKIGQSDQAYILGLLSLLDGMLDSPWEALIPSLPLSAEIAAALATRQGQLGRLLSAVESYEAFYTASSEQVWEASGFASLPAAFWEGSVYAHGMIASLSGN